MVHPGDLAALLRRAYLWPAGFVFNFWDCDHCAMGLMARHWNVDSLTPAKAARVLGISIRDAGDIFGHRGDGDGGRRAITPGAIADDLDGLGVREMEEV